MVLTRERESTGLQLRFGIYAFPMTLHTYIKIGEYCHHFCIKTLKRQPGSSAFSLNSGRCGQSAVLTCTFTVYNFIN